jgi:hypothetical protein
VLGIKVPLLQRLAKPDRHHSWSIRVEVISKMRRAWDFLRRVVAAMRLLARDERIPKPLRAIAGIGLLPIPGPFDEAVLVLIAPVFVALYREPMREAWEQAGSRI